VVEALVGSCGWLRCIDMDSRDLLI
jgi:hypothetical protein